MTDFIRTNRRIMIAAVSVTIFAAGVIFGGGQAWAASLDLNLNMARGTGGTVTYSNDGTYSGAVGGASDTWNVVWAQANGPHSYTNLKYADDASATGVQVQYVGGTARGADAWNRDNATLNIFDRHWHQGWGEGPNTVTISGLTAPSYDMYVYASAADITGSQDTEFIVGGTSYFVNWGAGGRNTSTLVQGDGNTGTTTPGENYLVFNGLTPTTGTISFQFDDNLTNGNGVFNALQLAAIPEPSTFVLAALGLLGLLAWGRRKRFRI